MSKRKQKRALSQAPSVLERRAFGAAPTRGAAAFLPPRGKRITISALSPLPSRSMTMPSPHLACRTSSPIRSDCGLRCSGAPTRPLWPAAIAASTMRSRLAAVRRPDEMPLSRRGRSHDADDSPQDPLREARLDPSICSTSRSGDLIEETTRRVVLRRPEQHPAPRVAEEQPLPCTGDADVRKASLLLQLVGLA